MDKLQTANQFRINRIKDSNQIDPVALEVAREMSDASAKITHQARWEHEDLAKVRIKVFRGHTNAVNKCQFICNESRVFSASVDCSIKVWDPTEGTELLSLNNAHDINAADAHCMEDGERFASCGWDKKLHFWDLEKGETIWSAEHTDMLTCCRLSHNGRLLCVGSDLFSELRVYDVSSGEVVQHMKEYHDKSLTSCCFSPDDTRIITTSTDRTTKFYDLRTDTRTITLEGHDNAVSSCSMTPDERKFATTSWDKTIQIWDISTGMYRSQGSKKLKGAHDGSVTCCNFSNDGLQLVSGSADLSIVVWDAENNVQKMKLQDHTVRMWNIEESDQIPMVMENKRANGLKVGKCTNCGKPFSLSEMENFQNQTWCVFCRLQSPEKSWLLFKDEPEF